MSRRPTRATMLMASTFPRASILNPMSRPSSFDELFGQLNAQLYGVGKQRQQRLERTEIL
jgi:hypothetical protein